MKTAKKTRTDTESSYEFTREEVIQALITTHGLSLQKVPQPLIMLDAENMNGRGVEDGVDKVTLTIRTTVMSED